MKTVLHIETDKDLGKISFIRNLRTKRMSIKILPQEIEINLPLQYSIEDGMKFLHSVREKIIKKQGKIVNRPTFLVTENSPIQTLTFSTELRKSNSSRNTIYSELKSGILQIEYPQDIDIKEQRYQKTIWESINYFLRIEAKRILPNRVQELANRHNFSFKDVKIQSSKTRWGSCNSKSAINLSFYLLLLPQHLIDYVILHELCHTKEMNHSPKFWKWMDKVTDNQSSSLQREVKNFHIPKL